VKKLSLGLIALATCLLATSAVAQSAAGTWKGKLKMDLSAMPKMQDPKMQAMIQQQMDMVKKMVLNLSLKSDKTYSITVTGLPKDAPSGNTKDAGTWSQTGDTVTIKSTMKKGNMNKPQTLMLSKDKKILNMVFPANAGPKASLTFTRG
jgi:hypothetical protein